jgi:hypothetical protein
MDNSVEISRIRNHLEARNPNTLKVGTVLHYIIGRPLFYYILLIVNFPPLVCLVLKFAVINVCAGTVLS